MPCFPARVYFSFVLAKEKEILRMYCFMPRNDGLFDFAPRKWAKLCCELRGGSRLLVENCKSQQTKMPIFF